MNRRVVSAVALLALLAGCASEQEAVQMAPLPEVKSEFSPSSQWSARVGAGAEHYVSDLAPALAYDKLFVAARDGEVKALDPETGKTLWQVNVRDGKPARLSGGITAAYNRLFIGSENAELIALNQETGEVLWRVTTAGEILSRPLAENTAVIVNTSRGNLEAFDALTGQSRWVISNEVPNLTLRGDSSPIAVSGGVFWGMANGRLGAALADSGQLLWQQPIASPKGATEIDRLVDVDASPMVVGDRLLAVGYNGELVSIALQTGQPAWRRAYSSSKDFVVAGQRLVLVTDKDHLVAVDVRSGTELWRNNDLEYRILTAPSVIDGYITVADSQGYLHWLDPATGDFVAQQKVSGNGLTHPPLQMPEGYLIVTRSGEVKHLQRK